MGRLVIAKDKQRSVFLSSLKLVGDLINASRTRPPPLSSGLLVDELMGCGLRSRSLASDSGLREGLCGKPAVTQPDTGIRSKSIPFPYLDLILQEAIRKMRITPDQARQVHDLISGVSSSHIRGRDIQPFVDTASFVRVVSQVCGKPVDLTDILSSIPGL